MCHHIVFSLVIIILFDNEVFALEKVSRQKRCIVIQKQSGGKADSGEGADDEDYDFKQPQPKDLKPDRLQDDINVKKKKYDVETISPERLKYKKIPKKAMYRRLRIKNHLLRNNLDM